MSRKATSRFDAYWLRYHKSLVDLRKIVEAQGNACPICGRHIDLDVPMYDPAKACVDHDTHSKTIRVRGLLCRTCNVGLGAFKDNIDFLNGAILYLQTTKENS